MKKKRRISVLLFCLHTFCAQFECDVVFQKNAQDGKYAFDLYTDAFEYIVENAIHWIL